MYVRIVKKMSASKRLLVALLSVVIPFALSSALSCMEEAEDSPLVQGSGSREESTLIDAQLPEVMVDPAWLEDINPQLAEEAMDAIIDYLAYVYDPDYIEEIEEKAKEKGYFIEDPAQFRGYLLNKAWEVVEKNTLNTYLGGLLDTTKILQKLVAELLEQSKLKNKKNTELLWKMNRILSEKENAVSPKEDEFIVNISNGEESDDREKRIIGQEGEFIGLISGNEINYSGNISNQEKIIRKQEKKIKKLKTRNRLLCAFYVPVCVIVGGVCVIVTLWWRSS